MMSVDGLDRITKEVLITSVQARLDRVQSKLMRKPEKYYRILETSGSDFLFRDREESFRLLADCSNDRYSSWVDGKSDKPLHPLPFVADGPGSGKSRFLQELSRSFTGFTITSNSYSDNFKKKFISK